MANTSNTTNKGKGLSRGPALALGSVLLAFGLIAMIKHSAFPAFGDGFPDGKVTGSKFLGIEVNGWTNWLVAVAGGLLLFGAAQHLLAKLMSLIVGLALAACAIIALIDGDILGLGAANGWTELGLGVAAVILLFNTALPRIGGDKTDDDVDGERDRQVIHEERHVQLMDETPDTDTSNGRRAGSVAIDRENT